MVNGDARLLATLVRLLSLDAADPNEALSAAAQLVGEALNADKVDIFLYHPEHQTLQVAGLSHTPMSEREIAIGMDRLTLADGGRLVDVFTTGESYANGHAAQDASYRRGFTEGLGIHSVLAAAVDVGAKRRGVVQAVSRREEAFAEQDRAFFDAVAGWVGIVLHRAELAAQQTLSAAEAGRRAGAEELVTVLAHDLRNLLAPIGLRLQILQRRFERDERAEDGEAIQHALDGISRLDALILNLLDASRIERGMFALELRAHDLCTLTRDSASALSTPETPIDVVAEVPMIPVRVDAARLQQVLANLLSNATRHSPPGAVVTVELAIVPEGTESLARLTVHNVGPGIPEEILPRIFDRFVKETGSSGLGLGLYLSQQITRAHGGTLTVTSSPEQGTAFTLLLPLLPGDEPTPTNGPPTPPAAHAR